MGFFKHPNLIYPEDKKEKDISGFIHKLISFFVIALMVITLLYFSIKGVR